MKNRSVGVNAQHICRWLVAVFTLCAAVAYGAFSDFAGTPSTSVPAGWGVVGTWTRNSLYGMTCSSTSGSITNIVPVRAADGFCVAVKLSASVVTPGAVARIICDYTDGSPADTNIVASLPTSASIFTFYPATAIGKDVLIRIELDGIIGGRSVTVAYCYHGETWFYDSVVVGDGEIGERWTSGSPVNLWASSSTPQAFQANVAFSGVAQKSVTAPFFQMKPPESDNIAVTFDLFNEPNLGSYPNDAIQIFAHTNSWIGGTAAGVAVGRSIPRYVADFGDNVWRTNLTVSGYISGIRGISTFQLGVEAQPGGQSRRSIYVRNIRIKFKTNIASDGAFWEQGGVVSGAFGENALSYGATNSLFTTIYPRPSDDAANLQTIVYRQALNRGAAVYQADVGNATGFVYCAGLDLPVQEAGETNLFRMVSTYASQADFVTDSPQFMPEPDATGVNTYMDADGTNWFIDVVQHKGTVWINELCNQPGGAYVELAAHTGRIIPTDITREERWSVVFGDGTRIELPVHTFTDDVHGVGFLTVPIPESVPAAGEVKLLNAVGVCEFVRDYDLAVTGVWGASGNGPYATDVTERADFGGHFEFGSLSIPTHGTTNVTQGIELPVGFVVQVTVIEEETREKLEFARITVQTEFSCQTDNRTVQGMTDVDGNTTNMMFVGRNASTNAVGITISQMAFGYFSDAVETNATEISLQAPYPTNRYDICLNAGPGIERFDTGNIPQYWEQITRFTGTTLINWSYQAYGADGRAIIPFSFIAANNSTVLKSINGVSPRNKKVASFSLTTFNNYNTSYPYDTAIPILSTNPVWASSSTDLLTFPSFRNQYEANNLPVWPQNSNVPYLTVRKTDELFESSAAVFVGIRAIAGGSSRSFISVDDLRVSFQDMLLGKRLAVRQHAADITRPVMLDVLAEVEAWGTNITRVVPSVVWRKTGTATWTTNSLVPYIDWRQVRGAMPGVEGSGVVTITNDATFAATNLPTLNLATQDSMEYYLLLQYDPDDADPARRDAGYNADGSLRMPESRFYPDNSEMVEGAWTCIAKVYAPQPLTNTVNGISDVWINEVSRNAEEGVADDFVELAGPAGASLDGWSVEVQDLAAPEMPPVVYPLSGTLNLGATNGYAFYVIGGSGVTPQSQGLVSALPVACGVTLADHKGNIRYRLAFNGAAPGFETVIDAGAPAAGEPSWSAMGEGNPGNRQYDWVGSGIPTPAAPNQDDDPIDTQSVENGGPIGTGVIGMVAVADTTDRLVINVSGAADADGVATGVVVVVQGAAEIKRLEFPGTAAAEFIISNLNENTRYDATVIYTDTQGTSREGNSAAFRYTLLDVPDAPALAGRTPSSVTVSTDMPNMAQGSSGAWFTGPSGNSGWLQANEWACLGLAPNALQAFDVKGRNGDEIETGKSAEAQYYTLANAPNAGIETSSSPWSPSLRVSVTNLTGGGAAAFGNPAYTAYMLVHSNVIAGTGGYVTTNGLVLSNASVSSDPQQATWLPIAEWHDMVVFGNAVTNDFYLVARNEDGVETLAGPAARGVISMQLELTAAAQVAEMPWRLTFSGRFMNPVAEVSTNHLALEVSTDAGATWQSASIQPASVQLGLGNDPTIDNGQAYPIRSVATENYTNTVLQGMWDVTNNLAWGTDYQAILRLAGTDNMTGAHSPATALVIDLSPPQAELTGVPYEYTRNTGINVTVVTPEAAEADDAVTLYRWKLEGPDARAWSADIAVGVPVTLAGLQEGEHRLLVIGRDAAGNWQTAAQATEHTWHIDLTSPASLFDTPLPNLRTNVLEAIFNMVESGPLGAERWEFSVTNVTAAAAVTNGLTANRRFTITLPDDADDGDYSLTVNAHDRAGNVSAATNFVWTLDRTAPVAEFAVTPAANGKWMTNAVWQVRVTGDADVAAYRWTLNDPAMPAGQIFYITDAASRDFAVDTLTEGTHTLRVWGCDDVGNWQTNVEEHLFTKTVDVTRPPAAMLGNIPRTYTTQTWIRVSVTNAHGLAEEDTVIRYEWLLAGATPGSGASPDLAALERTALQDGPYTLSVWGFDPAGLRQAQPTVTNWTVDTEAPIAAFEIPPLSDVNTNTITFVMVTNTPLNAVRWDYVVTNSAGVEVVSDTTVDNRFTVTVPDAEDDTYGITIWAYDEAGNRQGQNQEPPTTHAWEADFNPPVPLLVGVPAPYTQDQSPSIYATNNAAGLPTRDQVYQWTYALNGGENPARPDAPLLACGQAVDFTALADGAYQLHYWASDKALNWSAAYSTNWVVDTDAPAAVYVQRVPAYTNTYQVRIVMENTGDPTAAVEWRYRLPGGDIDWTVATTQDIAVVADGTYTNLVWARDTAHNEQANATTNIWRADTTAPLPDEVTITLESPEVHTRYKETNFTFSVAVKLPELFGESGNDTNAVYYYQVKDQFETRDMIGPLPVSSNMFIISARGADPSIDITNTVSVWAADWLGNTPAPAFEPAAAKTFTWVVDVWEPVAQYRVEPPDTNGRWQTNQVWQVTVTGDAQVVSYQWTIDDNGPTNTVPDRNTPFATSVLLEGAHTLKVWGRDEAGNWQTEPTEYSRIVDVTPPEAVVMNAPERYTNQTGVGITVTNALSVSEEKDTVVGYRWHLAGVRTDGTAISVVDDQLDLTALELSDLADGDYTLRFRGYDPAGNLQREEDATNIVWTVDTRAPAAAFAVPPLVDVNTDSISFELFSDGIPTNAVSWKYAVTNAVGDQIVLETVTDDPMIEVTVGVEGIYGIWIKASDAAGNEQEDVLTHVWEADWTALTPEALAVQGIPQPYTRALSTAVAVTNLPAAERKDTVSGWVFVLNGAQVRPEGWELAGGIATNLNGFIANAENTLYVWARDPAGNWMTSQAAFVTNWYVDLIPPSAEFLQVPAAHTNVREVAFLMASDGPLDAERWSFAVTNAAGQQVLADASDDAAFSVTVPDDDGEYRITVTAYDRAGNSTVSEEYRWTLDRVAPTAEITVRPPANNSWQTNKVWEVEITGDEDVVAYRWTTNDPVMPTTGERLIAMPEFSTAELGQGTNTLYVWGRDAAGNWQINATPYTKTVDTEWPAEVLILNQPVPDGGRTNAVAWVFAVGGADVDAYRWTTNSAVMPGYDGIPVTTPLEIGSGANPLDEGTYVLRVWGRDEAGNWNQEEPAQYTWIVDTTPPQEVLILDQPVPDGGRTNAVAWVFGVGGADVDAYRWTTNSSVMPGYDGIPVATPLEIGSAENPLADSTYVLRVWGRDEAGNWQELATQYTWTVDTVPPVAVFDVYPQASGIWQTNTAWTVAVTGDTQVVAYRWRLDGAESDEILINAGQDRLFLIEDLADGAHVLEVMGRDEAGNWQTNNIQRYEVMVDTTAPVAVLENVPPPFTRADGIAVKVTNVVDAAPQDTVTAYRWRLTHDSGTVSDWSEGTAVATLLTAETLQDGAYELSVVGRDPAGIWQTTPGTVTNWVRDTFAPRAWFDVAPPAFTNETGVYFSFGRTEDERESVAWRFEVLYGAVVVTNVAWTTDMEHVVTAVPESGIFTFRAWARDAAGNEQPPDEPTVAVCTVDSTAPEVSEIHILDLPGPEYVRTNVTEWTFRVAVDLPAWQGGGSDTNAWYQWALNDGERSTGNTPVSEALTVLSETGGEVTNTLTVWASDAAMNWQADGVTYTWIVDTIAPQATFDPVPASLLASLDADFTVAEGTDAVAWRFEVAGVTNGVSVARTFRVTMPEDGEYLLNVWASDVAGNEQPEPLTHDWRADTTPPDAVFETLPPVLVNTNTVAFTVADDNDSVAWHYVVTNAVLGEVLTGWIFAPTNGFEVTLPAQDGEYWIALFGRDEAGNMRALDNPVVPGGVFAWVLDTTAPEPGARFVRELMPHNPTNSIEVAAILAADADIVEWRVSLYKQDVDGVTWLPVVEGVAATNANGGAAPTEVAVHLFADDGTDDGVYMLQAVARDAAHNWQALPTSDGIHVWVFDRTPPTAVFGEVPAPLTQDRTSRFVASNLVEQIVKWKYRVTQRSREGLTLIPPEVCIDWTETSEAEFYVTVADEGAYSIELLGFDRAGNWQTTVDADGRYEWVVDEPSQLVGSIFRNTVVTNGNMEVAIAISLVDTNGLFDLIIEDSFGSLSGVAGVSCDGALLLGQVPTGNAETNLIKWLVLPQAGADVVVLRYTVPGLLTRTGMSGMAKWYEKTDRTERVRNMWVIPGTHQVYEAPPADGYDAWAAGHGLDPASAEGGRGGDADNDGVSNEDEYLADTLPNDANSFFRLTDIELGEPGKVRLYWHAGPAATLEFEWKRRLTEAVWRNFGIVPGGRGAEEPWWQEFAMPEEEGQPVPDAFFRVRATRE